MSNILRRFINEVFSTQQRHYFGPDPDEYRKAPGSEMNIDALLDAGFVTLGRGASRLTFLIPGIDDKVLKVVHYFGDRRLNRYEANNQLQTAFPEFIPQVYAAADDYEWIISERVDIISSDAQFDVILTKMFPALADVQIGPSAYDHFGGTPHRIMASMLKHSDDIYHADVVKRVNDKDVIKDIMRQMTRLIAMVHQFNIEPDEIRANNVGVRHGQQDSFVLLDASIFSE